MGNIRDISAGDNRFSGTPGLSPGQRGTVRFDVIARPIHFAVISHDGNQTGIQLDDDPAAASALQQLLEQHSRQAA